MPDKEMLRLSFHCPSSTAFYEKQNIKQCSDVVNVWMKIELAAVAVVGSSLLTSLTHSLSFPLRVGEGYTNAHTHKQIVCSYGLFFKI